MTSKNEGGALPSRALLPTLGAAIGAVFALATLVVATRNAQFTSIASFGAGAAITAIASVVIAGGTTLSYTTGDTARQRAARVARRTIVIPLVTTAAGVATLVYPLYVPLDYIGILAGGLATAASVSSELDASFLRRHLKTLPLLASDVTSRVLAFATIGLGGEFAIAMLAGALVRTALLRAATQEDPSRHGRNTMSLAQIRIAYQPQLTGLSILYSLCDRIGALTAPVAVPVSVAGGFVGVLSAQQNASGVLMSGLQTALAARARNRDLTWTSRLEFAMFGTGIAAATVMLLAQGPLLGILGLQQLTAPERFWIPIALLIPAAVVSRVYEFRFVAAGKYRSALLARAVATTTAIASGLGAVATAEIAVLATGLLLAELASTATAIAIRLASKRLTD